MWGIKRIRCPVLIVHGIEDSVVPYQVCLLVVLFVLSVFILKLFCHSVVWIYTKRGQKYRCPRYAGACHHASTRCSCCRRPIPITQIYCHSSSRVMGQWPMCSIPGADHNDLWDEQVRAAATKQDQHFSCSVWFFSVCSYRDFYTVSGYAVYRNRSVDCARTVSCSASSITALTISPLPLKRVQAIFWSKAATRRHGTYPSRSVHFRAVLSESMLRLLLCRRVGFGPVFLARAAQRVIGDSGRALLMFFWLLVSLSTAAYSISRLEQSRFLQTRAYHCNKCCNKMTRCRAGAAWS
jgi:hypothetical protein